MDYHCEQLAKHCRVCGRRLSKAKGKCTVYSCTDYQDQLLACFGMDVSHDSKNVHPPKFCNPCYTITKRRAKAIQDEVPYTSSMVPFLWTEHTHSCQVISNFQSRIETSIIITLIYMYVYPGLRALRKHC